MYHSQTTLSPTKAPVTLEPTVTATSEPTATLEPTCLRITTGNGTYDNGFLDVSVNNGDGSGYVEVTDSGINYPAESTVLEACYTPGLVGIQVSNPQTNAWGGSIETSVDGGFSYSAMECLEDCSGAITTEFIVVDGDGNGKGDTKCLNGDVCKLTVAPPPSPTISPSTQAPTETLSAA